MDGDRAGLAAALPGRPAARASPRRCDTIETAVPRHHRGPAAADRLLARLQQQAAVDLVMLPISQSDEHVYARAGVEVADGSFGPGWQLGLWGIGSG